MNPNAGMWPLAILMIVLVSWLLYRYVAPKGWKEWSRAGLIQAFIIALYAEMYGFPLTLYVLTGFFGIDIPMLHESGHLWATLLGLGPVGWMIEMAAAFVVIFAGISLVIQGWREVYRANSEGRFAASGPYAVIRHPQYMGIFVALFGQLIHWPTLPTLTLFPFIVWAYVRLARREEAAMISRFGEAYREYQERVPGFIPRAGQWRELFAGRAVNG